MGRNGDEFYLTAKMIESGVSVYLTPGRYESPASIVERIFWAILATSPAPHDGSTLNVPELGSEEVRHINIGHRRRRPHKK